MLRGFRAVNSRRPRRHRKCRFPCLGDNLILYKPVIDTGVLGGGGYLVIPSGIQRTDFQCGAMIRNYVRGFGVHLCVPPRMGTIYRGIVIKRERVMRTAGEIS